MNIRDEIISIIRDLLDNSNIEITDNTPLIGDGCLIDSMNLVELCLHLEDKSTELKFEFDWTSETAMSKSRSMFRTVGSLISEFLNQMEQKR